jgi:chromosome segregation ATPase
MDVNRKIRIDGDYLQSYQDDYMELQVDKMNQRVTFFSIVFVILLGIAFTFGFFYIRSNVTKVPKEVQDLSHQVVQRMSLISERHKQMESSFHSKLSLLEKVTEALRKDQKEIQDAVDKINRTKADQNDVGRILGKSSQENFEAIEEVRSYMNKMNTTFTTQFNKFSEQFEAFNKDVNEIVQRSITQIQEDVKNRIDKLSGRFQTINTEMNSFAKDVKTLDSNVQTLKSELDTFNKRIADISSAINTLSSDLTNISKSYKDTIDSDHLEELLAIERKSFQNNLDLQKALLENHIKVLDEKIDQFNQKIEQIQKNAAQSARENKGTFARPHIKQQLPVNSQLPVKTRKKDLIRKTETQEYVKPLVTKPPPPGVMIEEDLPE